MFVCNGLLISEATLYTHRSQNNGYRWTGLTHIISTAFIKALCFDRVI